ncbi:MAG TPA: DUF5667 domain-containing protein [Anaerolineaceae bacterium]
MLDTEQRTALILQTCIEAIQTGQDTLESVLRRYPELEDTLRPQLESAFWLMERRSLVDIEPDAVHRRRLRFEARIRAEQRAARPSFKEVLLSVFRLPPVALRAAVTVAMVFILLIATDRVVTATEGAIPGDPGYSVKRTVEDISLAVSPDPGQRIVLYLEYSERRLSETDVLVDMSRYTDATETLDEFEEQVRYAVASLDSVPDQDTVHKELLAMTIQDKLIDHTRKLDAILPKMPDAAKPAVQSAMLVSNDGAVVASTAIKRLMTMQTPMPSGPFALPTIFGSETPFFLGTPTEEVFSLPYLTPTEEFKQIFSSTTAPEATKSSQRDTTPIPTLPIFSITATPRPTDPGYQEPTEIPTLPPAPSRTPLPTYTVTPPTNTPTPEPTLSGVFTPTATAFIPNASEDPNIGSQLASPTFTPVP